MIRKSTGQIDENIDAGQTDNEYSDLDDSIADETFDIEKELGCPSQSAAYYSSDDDNN